MTLTSRYGEELSISLRQSSSFCRVACPRRPATRPSTVRTCPVMPSAYRRVILARFGRVQMGRGCLVIRKTQVNEGLRGLSGTWFRVADPTFVYLLCSF